jgi:phosphoribosylformylglycinamidine cyclo-ligase
MTDEERMTYSGAGVDIADSEAATTALLGAVGEFEGEDGSESDYAGLLDIGDRYLALATDGVGTKLLVAEALSDYSTVGIDCIAMNANDLIAAGIEPVAFVDYLAIDEPDDKTAEQVGTGLSMGAAEAGCALVGGETAVMPEVVSGLDLAGTCAGLAPKDAVFPGEAEPGDALIGFPSNGIHSNGLTLARKATTENYAYTDPFPLDKTEAKTESESGPESEVEVESESRSIGEVLLEPTRIYADVLGPLREHASHAAAHVTGGGWTNLSRMGEFHYEITDQFRAQPVFEFVQREGNISDEEMHRTFNMGTGFVAALAPDNAEKVVEDTNDGRIIGRVEEGEGVEIRGLTIR